MYNHLKEKFNINEYQIDEFAKENQDYGELFNDYETLCFQIEKYELDFEMYNHYMVLIKELEEEIFRILSNQESQNGC